MNKDAERIPTDMGAQQTLLRFDDVSKIYRGRRTKPTVAVSQVSFSLTAGCITALVGESGSGKTTIARLVTGIEKPTSGSIQFRSSPVESLSVRQLTQYRRHVQMIFQDPYASLNPHNTVLYTIERPLINHKGLDRDKAKEQAQRVMEMVRLAPVDQYIDKRPHQLSGGQRQRLVIARAIAVEPDLVVADEPVSMLDVSIRADVLHLIGDLRDRIGMSVLYITHDLLSARVLADEILVLYRGHLVEKGPSREVILHARHPYTKLLLESIPNPWRRFDDESQTVPDDVSTPSSQIPLASVQGCPFYHRCGLATDKCRTQTPELQGEAAHQAACFYS